MRPPITLHLSIAVLCPNCEVISDSPHDTCPACGNKGLLSLANALNPKPLQAFVRRFNAVQTPAIRSEKASGAL